MDQLISKTATATLVEPIMRDISMDEIEAVSGGLTYLQVGGAVGAAAFAFGVGYAIGTFLYNNNFPGTHWV